MARTLEAFLVFFLLAMEGPALQAGQVELVGPPGSGNFGSIVKVLPNGNFVVTDPGYSPDNQSHPGAVYLYSPSHVLISTLTGGPAGWAGSGGIYVLNNGNFVVCSPDWSSGGSFHAGAVTWANGSTGLNGEISASNSMVGELGDYLCLNGIVPLANGNYVVPSPGWGNGTVNAIGAVTWCDGTLGCHGTVSASNSLVGSSAGDFVGNDGVFALPNGDYVVTSASWNNGSVANAGAVTLCHGPGGCVGTVTAENSLVGSSASDLVGSGAPQSIGGAGVSALVNGNFVVTSPNWHAGNAAVGAITWINAQNPLVGPVTSANSLIGSTDGDMNEAIVTALTNGNYVTSSPYWNDGATADVGAVTFCNGFVGCTGVISAANSLVGSTANDRVGFIPSVALTNDSYVVVSPYWNNGSATLVGAVSLCSGESGCRGTISPLMSGTITGTNASDIIGNSGVTALTNGNFVIGSSYWNNGPTFGVGAATWCNGANGCTGQINATNSLIGSTAGDEIADDAPQGVHALTNGHYVVYSKHWTSSGTTVGAVTWGNGNEGFVGTVTAGNSFVGITTGDDLGGPRVFSVANGNYIISSPSWLNAGVANAGAVSLLRGFGPQTGTITTNNSVTGSVANGGQLMSFDYAAASDTLVVGKPSENTVTFLQIDQLFFDSFE
jgi:hypothetical protein